MTTITTTTIRTTTESAKTTTAAFLAQFAHAAQEHATSRAIRSLYSEGCPDSIELKPEQ